MVNRLIDRFDPVILESVGSLQSFKVRQYARPVHKTFRPELQGYSFCELACLVTPTERN